jgi:threonine dehydrogenase-like Zn-dependent dehydrogenase
MPAYTMQAVVCHGPEDYRVQEVPVPRPGRGELLEEDAPARVKALTEGYGCDVYIEITGNAAAPQQGLEMIRRLGTLVAFSVLNERATIDWNLVGDQKELNVHGSHLGPYCYPKTIRAIADGTIDVESLISAEYPLAEFAAAMDAARGGANLKTLLIPG